MLQLASKYKDLEHKYQHLATLAHNQSEIIAQLEEHCQRVPAARPVPQPPPATPPRVYQPPPTTASSTRSPPTRSRVTRT